MSELDTEIRPTAQTEYIVLRRVEANELSDPILWEEIDAGVPAISAEGAIRATAAALSKQPEQGGGVYAASPMRSWKPVKVSSEQTITLKLEQAT